MCMQQQQANPAFGSFYLIPTPIKRIRAPDGKKAYSRTGAGNTQDEPGAFVVPESRKVLKQTNNLHNDGECQKDTGAN